MNYTVQELAKLSRVSIRTLRYYDEINLLKPAFIGDNKYRYYQEEQLLRLQQILFFKELGFELKQIQDILGRSDFDTLKALQIHAIKVHERMERLKTLSKTIETTIKYLEGKQSMKDKEMYYGFDSERQKQYEKELEEYFGKKPKETQQAFARHKKEADANVKNWTKEDWKKSHETFHAICTDLTNLLKEDASPQDPSVQKVITQHFAWLSKFWKPNKESYKGHTEFIMHSELKDAYNKYHPKLAEFLVKAIVYFADHSL